MSRESAEEKDFFFHSLSGSGKLKKTPGTLLEIPGEVKKGQMNLFHRGAHNKFGAFAGSDLSPFEDRLKGGELLPGVIPNHNGVERCRERKFKTTFCPWGSQPDWGLFGSPVLFDDLECLLKERIILSHPDQFLVQIPLERFTRNEFNIAAFFSAGSQQNGHIVVTEGNFNGIVEQIGDPGAGGDALFCKKVEHLKFRSRKLTFVLVGKNAGKMDLHPCSCGRDLLKFHAGIQLKGAL